MPLFSRLWFAWACFFRVLFDASFAARADLVRDALPEAPPAPSPASAAERAEKSPKRPVETQDTSALLLLALLQREARFIDFVQEDLTGAADADVGVAARVVHEGCRKALKAHLEIVPIRPEAEEASIDLPAQFDASAIKLTGDVTGSGPYRGKLRHPGWRAQKVVLPTALAGHDPHVLAQAEVAL